MYICTKCDSVFDAKIKVHGKARKPNKKLNYFPCDGELVECELKKATRGSTKFQICL